MKKIVIFLLALLLVFATFTTAFAADNLSITIDGKQVVFSDTYGYPYIDENNRTQVPLRVVMEQFGCDVEWNSAERTAIVSKSGTTVLVPIGEKRIVVNGKTVAIDTEAVIKGGRTYLPIRAVLEAFGAKVDWDNGRVTVTSPSAAAIENIYIDKDGNLILERANGNKVNLGKVSNGADGAAGADGKDGVSVTDAKVDSSGNLIITLSNGRSINAGNVTSGGSLDFLTFEDYPVGTKFYLIKPIGEFDVPCLLNNEQYTIHFSNVYYELTEKNDSDEAWIVKNGTTQYQPYLVTVYIEGYTSTALAGKGISVVLSDALYGNWLYDGNIDAEGRFSISLKQGYPYTSWHAPKTMFFGQVTIYSGTTPPDELTTEEIVALIAGDWNASPTEKVVVNTDGTIEYGGTEYTPEYRYQREDLINVSFNDFSMTFYPSAKTMRNYDNNLEYYKDRTWTEVTLTKDNFFDYYEVTEEFTISYDVFGDFVRAEIDYDMSLKEAYAEKVDPQISDMAVKYNRTTYRSGYAIDLENETYSLSDPNYTDEGLQRGLVGYEIGGFNIGNTLLTKISGYEYFYKDYQIEKAQGTLYLINE